MTTAFLQANGFAPGERSKFVKLTPYKGARPQVMQLMRVSITVLYGRRTAGCADAVVRNVYRVDDLDRLRAGL